MLYFIKSGNYCKIGYSRDLKALFTRLRNYLTHNPSFQILDLRKGDKITEENVRSIRPGNGMHTKHYDEVLGRTAAMDIEKGTPLSWDLLE